MGAMAITGRLVPGFGLWVASIAMLTEQNRELAEQTRELATQHVIAHVILSQNAYDPNLGALAALPPWRPCPTMAH